MITENEKIEWIDSHCHLGMEPFETDLDAVLERAEAAGVTRMICIGTCPKDWDICIELAQRESLRSTVGLHPHEASQYSSTLLGEIEGACLRPEVLALGEIGLDYHYDFSPRSIQREAFEAQVDLAGRIGLPVVIHSREAVGDTLDILRCAGKNLRGVVHCYTYGMEPLESFLELGLHISFSGVVTFPKAPEIQEAALRVPPDRILVETDAPYLAPVPFRGKRCEPAFAASTGAFLARLRGADEADFAAQTRRNTGDLFGWM